MSAQDYRINAEVRRLLVSRWVDVSRLQVGTTNGVVYILGALDATVQRPVRSQAADWPGEREAAIGMPSPAQRLLHLAVSLEKEIRRLQGVRDVVFKLDNMSKRGGRWRPVESES